MLGDLKNPMEFPNTRVKSKYTKVTNRRQRISKTLYLPQKL
jgi:hypothetical protein